MHSEARHRVSFYPTEPRQAQAKGNPYNGFSWAQRLAKFEEMKRRLHLGTLVKPAGPCRLCGDPGDAAGGVDFEYHDEDYSREYSWAEPAAYVLCHSCHVHRLHMRFAHPIAWQAFLAHVRRGGYARDLQNADVKAELERYRRAISQGQEPRPLCPMRAYDEVAGEEWFAILTMDWKDMECRG